jgi:hypothetical protein
MNTEEEILQLKEEIKKLKLRVNVIRHAIKDGAEKTDEELSYHDWKVYGKYDEEYVEDEKEEEENK